jgi:hypothetical protein
VTHRRPRRHLFRRGVYRSRNTFTWPERIATALAALIVTAAIVLAALALADWYIRSTA